MLYVTAGTKIRAFTLTECLGKGGMSAVWKANHGETGQDYALKILHGSVVDDPSVRQRFFEEGLIQSRVAHPNVVAVKGRIEEHPVHALVMEYIEGPTLSGYVKERPHGLFMPEVKAIATGILSGLNAAHRRGIVHRDVKPSNVLLARDFYTITPKLTDFGIAKVKYGRLQTVTSAPMGTPHFMSPEQLRDSKRVTLQTDIYSFGVTLYYMVTGSLPFEGDDLNALMLKIIQGGHQPPSYHREELPPALDELIERCLAPRRDDRPENCRAVLESILAIDWNQSESSAPRAAPRPKPRKKPDAPESIEPIDEPTLPQSGQTKPLHAVEPESKPSAPAETPPAEPSTPTEKMAPAPRRAARSVSSLDMQADEPTWQLDGPDESDFDDEDLTVSFRRRGRAPLVVGLLILIAGAAFATKAFLDYQASQRVEPVPAGTATEALEPGESAASEPVASRDTNATASGADGTGESAAVASAGSDKPVPPTSDGTGGNPTDSESSADLAAARSVEPEAEAVATEAEGQPSQPERDDATAELAVIAVAPSGAPDDTDGDAPSRTSATEASSDDDDDDDEGSSRERDEDSDSERRSRRRQSDDGELTGREAERAAELAWEERQRRTAAGEELPPTIRVTGPGDDPTAALLGEDGADASAAPPEPANEELSPIQINRTLGSRRSEFRACFEGSESGPVEMRIRITPEGVVSFARATDSEADRRVVACLVRELGGLEFDSFNGRAMNVRRTFTRVGPS